MGTQNARANVFTPMTDLVRTDFDLKQLYAAIDEKRRAEAMRWTAVTRHINRFDTVGHPIATSTIRGLANKSVAEGDGVLQPVEVG